MPHQHTAGRCGLQQKKLQSLIWGRYTLVWGLWLSRCCQGCCCALQSSIFPLFVDKSAAPSCFSDMSFHKRTGGWNILSCLCHSFSPCIIQSHPLSGYKFSVIIQNTCNALHLRMMTFSDLTNKIRVESRAFSNLPEMSVNRCDPYIYTCVCVCTCTLRHAQFYLAQYFNCLKTEWADLVQEENNQRITVVLRDHLLNT